ncbi:MAG: AsmA-like C-terminal region-containing protein [Flavobacteriales bacterium]
MKRIIKIFVGSLLVIFIALLALPFVFKGKIVNLIKTEANKQLTATLDFKDVSLSLIRNFPYLSVSIIDLSIANQGVFEGDTLIRAGKTALTVNLMSVIKGDEIGIRSILIENAAIHVKVLEDGTANYDIVKPSDEEVKTDEPEEPSAFKIALRRYELNQVNIIYDDRSLGFYTKIDGLKHSGKGDFTADQTNLSTDTDIASLDLKYEGVKYLSKVKVSYQADFDLNLKESIYAFKDNTLRLNELPLSFQGKVAMPGNDIDMDMSFAAKKSEFKEFLSIVPGSFTEDFKDLKSSGTLAFDGYVKGIYNEQSIPGFNINLKVDNGMFQYPSLPEAVRNVKVNCSVRNPGRDADLTVVEVSVFRLDFGPYPFDATLLLRNPVSDPFIDSKVKTNMDLASVKNFYPLEQGTNLGGMLNADMAFKGRMSAIEKEQYEQFEARGNLDLKNFTYQDGDLKDPVKISDAAFNFNPRFAELSKLIMNIGKSDMALNGKLENYLAYVLKDETLKGSLTLSSRLLDVNALLDDGNSDVNGSNASTTESSESLEYFQLPKNIDFTFNANLEKVLYSDMDINNLKGVLMLREGVFSMRNAGLEMLGGSMTTNGTYDTRRSDGANIDFNLNIRDINIREAANTFVTIQQIAPIAKNTVGRASGSISFAMQTDQQLQPIFNTLDGKGNLQTSMIVIEGFEMIKSIAEALKIDKLKKWQMEKTNLGFEIKQGRIFIDPFDTKVGNYKARIGGSNGFDQSISYVMNLEIPRAEFGGQANAVLNNLVAQANTKGINASVGDIIPVELRIGGTFANPTVSTDLRDRANDAFKNLKDEAEQKLREEADRLKKELEDKARSEAERLKNEAEDRVKQEADKAKQEAERIKQETERKAREEADRAKREAERKAKEEAEKRAKDIFKR